MHEAVDFTKYDYFPLLTGYTSLDANTIMLKQAKYKCMYDLTNTMPIYYRPHSAIRYYISFFMNSTSFFNFSFHLRDLNRMWSQFSKIFNNMFVLLNEILE